MKKEFGKYYIGLDIGTSSVGWAVTDLNYNILKFNGKAMWGCRLFDEAKTSEERRGFRSARRRNMRKVQRIKLLQELFSEEMALKDFSFFMRLKDSTLLEEDKEIHQANTLFNDEDYKDEDYHRTYPTIYHLRKELAESNEPHDIRLVYLAIHHILKHRGHFLLAGEFSDVSELSLEPLVMELSSIAEDVMDMKFDCVDTDSVRALMTDQGMNISEKKKAMEKAFDFERDHAKQARAVFSLLSKGKVKLSDIFADESLKGEELDSISFSDTGFEDNEEGYRSLLESRYAFIEKAKEIFDWGVLQYVLSGEKSISAAKLKCYEQHKADLQMLKAAVRDIIPESYKRIFGVPHEKESNYSAYIGSCKAGGRKHVIESTCAQEDFCKFLKGLFNDKVIDEGLYPGLQQKIETNTLLPKQRVKDNGVIPYQIHKKELQQILDNAEKYLGFLSECDDKGISVKEKIMSIMTYRIPYYVGPVNTAHDGIGGFSWAVRKSSEPVRPWNFDDVIDREASAEKFIRRMTNKCTYLHGEDVLPKDSLLYSRFMVLNELNNLRIDGEKIPNGLKKDIFNDLFLKTKKVTRKKLEKYLAAEGYKVSDISGIDGDFKASMNSYIDFKEILGKDTFTDDEKEMIEDIIKYIVLFGEDRKLLKKKIRSMCGDKLTDEQLKAVVKKKYSGWGRLSEKFLDGIYTIDPQTGEYCSIISMMYDHDDNPNLMMLLSNDYPFSKMIEEENAMLGNESEDISYEDLDALYVSVPVKRSIWQTVGIMKEIRKIAGHDPEKVFIEMARGADADQKGRTVSRKNRLLDLYKACRKEEPELYELLEQTEDNKLRRDKLYLYYTQLGKCMYSGQRIELDSLEDYDIDHIYPQSRVMDDSIDNRVLVHRTLNAKKGDKYPIPGEVAFRESMGTFWKMLYHKKLISRTKYERLIRTAPFSEGELEGFVGRQIVETRQSTKAAAQILKKMLKDTEIVYVKAGNVSEFRRGVDNLAHDRNSCSIREKRDSNRFIKVRAINDFHHAKDAYLNIVVGNVFHTKFTSDPRNFFRERDAKYSFNAMYRFPVERNGVTAWLPETEESEGTMATVKKYMAKNNILYTRYAVEVKGGFFKQQILKKGKGQVPVKGKGALSDISKYGGYNKPTGAYFFLVEHTEKGERVKTIETMLAYRKHMIRSDADLEHYCVDELHLEDPVVLIKKIKTGALLELDGFRMHVSGRTGKHIIVRNANQLVLGAKDEEYLKKIDNFMTRRRENKELKVSAFDRISEEENIKLYDLLFSKLSETIYRIKLESQIKTIRDNKEKFEGLSIEEQCYVLMQILELFKCNVVTSDFKLIGGSANAGKLLINKKMDNLKNLYMIDQSVTGLFEKKTRLV